MKLVRARVSEDEYRLLRERAKVRGTRMETIVREAVRAHLGSFRMDPDDPIMSGFPLVPKRKGRRRDNASERHDEILYGTLH